MRGVVGPCAGEVLAVRVLCMLSAEAMARAFCSHAGRAVPLAGPSAPLYPEKMAAHSGARLPPAPSTERHGRVLLVDASSRSLERLAQCLRPIAADLTAEASLAAVDPEGRYDLLAVNYDSLSPAERESLVEMASRWAPRPRLLLLANGNVRNDLPKLFASGMLTNLMAKNDEFAPQDLIVTVQKILRSDIFGLEKYFSWGIEPLTFEIRFASGKAEVLRTTEEYATKLGINSRIAAHLSTVVDEFLTNAIFNAPTTPEGQHRFAHLPRTSPVELGADEVVTMKLCCDGRQLGVSVSDPFGSLSEKRVLDYLAKCFRKEADQVDRKAGGAGLGLFYAFDALSHFVINIRPKQQTEMIGLLKLTATYRDFAAQSKSFNMFVSE